MKGGIVTFLAALQAFDATVDLDGNTLLDNTVVVYVSEVARAYDHDQRNMPLALFGGKNTRLQGGTFLKVSGGSHDGRSWSSSAIRMCRSTPVRATAVTRIS